MGMDKKIELKWYQTRKYKLYIGIFTSFLLLLFFILTVDSKSTLNVNSDRITISNIERKPFQEYVPLTATVMPQKTVYLDAIEGGRVEVVMKEAGSVVNVGDTILLLSNTSLLLDIMNREAQLFEQRNNLRNSRLALQQNELRLESELLELDNRLSIVERKYNQYRELNDKNYISNNTFDSVSNDLNYLIKRKELVLETQLQDSIFRSLQIEMLEASVKRIQANLGVVRKNLENLHLRAPVAGQLTSLNAELGESKRRGERLGQIDILDGFKIRAFIDEHYISRVNVGLSGSFQLSDDKYDLTITKIYPEVSNGRFELDMEFKSEIPKNIRRGQSVHVRLELGDITETLLLQRGSFYQKTGGRWIYVLDQSGEFATRREIKLGQQNPYYFEILEGLIEGEKVITSSYENYGEIEKIILE
jgi:HlyD family secretion protein